MIEQALVEFSKKNSCPSNVIALRYGITVAELWSAFARMMAGAVR